MAAASGHKLCWSRGRHPVVPVEVRDIQVKNFGDQGTGGDASPGTTQKTGLIVALV